MMHLDQQLFEKFALHFMDRYNYPPLVSKICAYLLFDYEREGITFEELTDYFEVSKSSVSEAIKYLLDHNHIRFNTKAHCRKRFFVMNEDFVTLRYQLICDNLQSEKQLIEAMQRHKQSTGIHNRVLEERMKVFVKTLNENTQNLEAAIKELRAIHH